MPQTSYRDQQNPWLANQSNNPAAPAPSTPGLPGTAWQGLGPGISNVRDGGDLRKWIDPKNYQNWTRDQWRAAMQFGTYNGPNSFMGELEGLIGTHAINQHKNYFNAGGQGYLPGHFDYNTGNMIYNGIDPNLVTQVNNRAFNFSNGSTSGAPVGPNGQLGTHMNTGTISPTMAGQMPTGNSFKPNPQGVFTSNPTAPSVNANAGPAAYAPTPFNGIQASPRYSGVRPPTVGNQPIQNSNTTLPTMSQGTVRNRPYYYQPAS
jgi:hypothetical protein